MRRWKRGRPSPDAGGRQTRGSRRTDHEGPQVSTGASALRGLGADAGQSPRSPAARPVALAEWCGQPDLRPVQAGGGSASGGVAQWQSAEQGQQAGPERSTGVRFPSPLREREQQAVPCPAAARWADGGQGSPVRPGSAARGRAGRPRRAGPLCAAGAEPAVGLLRLVGVVRWLNPPDAGVLVCSMVALYAVFELGGTYGIWWPLLTGGPLLVALLTAASTRDVRARRRWRRALERRREGQR